MNRRAAEEYGSGVRPMTPRPSRWQAGEEPSTGLARARSLLRRGELAFGLWLLPLFVASAMIGATLATAFVVAHYGRQVSTLKSETRDARAEVEQAREEVLEAAEDARRSIEEAVRRARSEQSP